MSFDTMDEIIFGSPELFNFYSPAEVRETPTDFNTFDSVVDGLLETVISETTELDDPSEEGADLLHIISSSLDRFNALLYTDTPIDPPNSDLGTPPYSPFSSQIASANPALGHSSSNSTMSNWLSSELPHNLSPSLRSVLPSPSLEMSYMQNSFVPGDTNQTNNSNYANIGQPPGLPRISPLEKVSHFDFVAGDSNCSLSHLDHTYFQPKITEQRNELKSKWGSPPPDMVTLSSDSGFASDPLLSGLQFWSSSNQLPSDYSADFRTEDQFSQMSLRSPPIYVDCPRGFLSGRSPSKLANSLFSLERNSPMQFNIDLPKGGSVRNSFLFSSGSTTAAMALKAKCFQESLADQNHLIKINSHSYPNAKDLSVAKCDSKAAILALPKTGRTNYRPEFLSTAFLSTENGHRRAEPSGSQMGFSRYSNRSTLPLRSNSVIIGQLGSPPIQSRFPEQQNPNCRHKSQQKLSSNARDQKYKLNHNCMSKAVPVGDNSTHHATVASRYGVTGNSSSKGNARRLIKSESVASSSDSTMDAGKPVIAKWRRACSFYLRGHCKKEDCEFAHDLTKVTCKFWELGECFKGATCPFLHGYPPELLEHESSQVLPLPSAVLASSNFTAAVQ